MSELLDILQNSSENHVKRKYSNPFYYVLGFTGGLAVMITVASVPFLSPAFRKICLPFVPASQPQIINVLKALKYRSGTLVDLGSGDGRIVRAAASLGFHAIGIELNIWLVLYSRLVSCMKKYAGSVRFYRQNLWYFNLRPYDNVVVFGTEEMMPELENKCKQELREGSVVIACRFPLPNTQSEEIIGEGVDTVWKYTIKGVS